MSWTNATDGLFYWAKDKNCNPIFRVMNSENNPITDGTITLSQEGGLMVNMPLLNQTHDLTNGGLLTEPEFIFKVKASLEGTVENPNSFPNLIIDKPISLKIKFFDCNPIKITTFAQQLNLNYDVSLVNNSHQVQLSSLF